MSGPRCTLCGAMIGEEDGSCACSFSQPETTEQKEHSSAWVLPFLAVLVVLAVVIYLIFWPTK